MLYNKYFLKKRYIDSPAMEINVDTMTNNNVQGGGDLKVNPSQDRLLPVTMNVNITTMIIIKPTLMPVFSDMRYKNAAR